jgi:choline kinase
MQPVKTLILSAGQGKRLSPLTDDRPKCLVELAGRTVLEWQLRHLHQAGVTEAVVVTGFRADLVEAEVAGLTSSGGALPGMSVRTLYNPFYSVTDNLATCWLAREEMKGGPFMILNGDTLFEPGIAERLISAPDAPITVTVDRKDDGVYDSDDMKVLTDGDALRAIGKTITEYDAESIGFLRFNAEGSALFVKTLEGIMRTPEGLKRWYLSVINEIAQNHDVVRVRSIQGLEWAEMDFPEDLIGNRALTAKWAAAEAEAV